MKWFKDCQTLGEVKAQYKKLAKQYHPDLGGDISIKNTLLPPQK
jgi:hypothetical protein